MNNQIILQGISAKELIDIFDERLKKHLSNLKLDNQPEQDPLLDYIEKNEAMEILGVSSATLWRWEKKGDIQSYGIGGKRYYKRNELESAFKRIKK